MPPSIARPTHCGGLIVALFVAAWTSWTTDHPNAGPNVKPSLPDRNVS